jgi:hypothetical protein
MTMKIALSQVKALPFDFEAAVTAFIKAKKDHRSTEGVPAPSAPHPYIEAAVVRVPGSIEEHRADDFVADYEIIDDTPPAVPPPTLEQRKMALAVQVGVLANEAIAKVIPPLKQRLWDREHARVLGDIGKIKIQENEPMDVWRGRALSTIKQTAPADHASFTAHEDRKRKVDAIIHQVALGESAIHDLTEETIEAWQPAPFPGA